MALVEAVPVLSDSAGFEGEDLDRGLHDGYGSFELVGGVADETALLGERVLEVFRGRFGWCGRGGLASLVARTSSDGSKVQDVAETVEALAASSRSGAMPRLRSQIMAMPVAARRRRLGYGVEGHFFEDAVP